MTKLRDANELVAMVFSGLPPLAVENVVDGGERIWVRARTPEGPVACPDCEAETVRVHGYHERTVADVPVDGRRVVVRVRVRRLVCPTRGCRQTFREQLPGVLERYRRRTPRLASQIGVVVRESAGRAAVRVLSVLPVRLSRHTALRLLLLRLPLPRPTGARGLVRGRLRAAPPPPLRHRPDQRPDPGADRRAARPGGRHPGGVAARSPRREGRVPGRLGHICRGDPQSPTRSGAGRRSPAPWNGLCEAVDREVKAHSCCWAPVFGQQLYEGPRAQSTLERWHQVHDLLERGVGLLECARRLQLALNTVKRYARADRPEQMLRVPRYRPTLVDPYRDHLRRRRDEEPGVPVKHLFEEIKTLGYTGSLNLLHKYIDQGRVEADRSPTSPRRLSRILLSRPDHLTDTQRELVGKVAASCPERSILLEHVRTFAALLAPPPRRQRSAPCRLAREQSCRRPAPPALLHPRPAAGPRRHHRSPHPP
ncbi:transposase-like protein [Streptomyces sp. TE5632]